MLRIHKYIHERAHQKVLRATAQVGRYTDRANCIVRATVERRRRRGCCPSGDGRCAAGGGRNAETRSEMTAFIIQFCRHYRMYIS